jgi:transposase
MNALQRDLSVEELIDLNTRIRRVERRLNQIADADPRVTLLKSIPGVGRRTAEAIVAYVDDIRRFARNRQVGAYFGLVPCQDASADRNRLGHITRAMGLRSCANCCARRAGKACVAARRCGRTSSD